MAANDQSMLFKGRGMTDTMYDRWRSHRHIAQSAEAANSDARPTGMVFVTRGVMQRFVNRSNENPGMHWRGIWDEKYTWGGMPGQVFNVHKSILGNERDPAFRTAVEIPHVKSITIRNNVDQNGVGNATVVVANIYREANTGIDGFLYHILREGFFSPHFDGDANFDVEDVDLHLGQANRSGMAVNADGKVLTGLVQPNRKIEIFQGYGDEVQRTFVGIIDTVSIDTKTGEMTLEMTDFGRILTDTTYNQFSTPPGRYPVAFCDWGFVKGVARKNWRKKFGILSTATPIIDVTHVAGRIYGWAGFHTWNRVRAGRIGRIGTGSVVVRDQKRKIRATFTGENFDKGNHFIDGINQIKTLLGYMQFITPDWHEEVEPVKGSSGGGTIPGSQRFRDPTYYDDEYSRYANGVPNFVPPNVWKLPSGENVEQFLDSELLLDGGIVYDYSPLRKNMYVVGTGHKTKRGGQRIFGYSCPYSIGGGIAPPIYFNAQEELGIHLTELEIQIFIRRTMMNTLMYYNRGSFTVPGWPAVALNKQVDILDSKLGSWRRFFVTGFESEMSLGPKSSWSTTVEVVNVDNVYIKRIKNQIKKLMNVDLDTNYDDLMFQRPKGTRTPAYIMKPGRGN